MGWPCPPSQAARRLGKRLADGVERGFDVNALPLVAQKRQEFPVGAG